MALKKLAPLVHAFYSETAARVDGTGLYINEYGETVECTEIVGNPYYGMQQYDERLDDVQYVGMVSEFVGVGRHPRG